MDAAEPYKDELLRRGVFLVPITLDGDMRADLPPVDKSQEGETKCARMPCRVLKRQKPQSMRRLCMHGVCLYAAEAV